MSRPRPIPPSLRSDSCHVVAFSPRGGDGTRESGDETRGGRASAVGEVRGEVGESPVVAVVPDIDVKVFHLGRTYTLLAWVARNQ